MIKNIALSPIKIYFSPNSKYHCSSPKFLSPLPQKKIQPLFHLHAHGFKNQPSTPIRRQILSNKKENQKLQTGPLSPKPKINIQYISPPKKIQVLRSENNLKGNPYMLEKRISKEEGKKKVQKKQPKKPQILQKSSKKREQRIKEQTLSTRSNRKSQKKSEDFQVDKTIIDGLNIKYESMTAKDFSCLGDDYFE